MEIDKFPNAPDLSNRPNNLARSRFLLAAIFSGAFLSACHKQDHFIEPAAPIVRIPDPEEKDSRYEEQEHNRHCQSETQDLKEIAAKHAISEAEMRCLESNGIFLKMDCNQAFLDVSDVKPVNEDSKMGSLYLERLLVSKVNCNNYSDSCIVSIYLQSANGTDEYVYRYESDLMPEDEFYDESGRY